MKPLIIANWKMNPLTVAETKRLFNLVQRRINNIRGLEIVICPSFPFLLALKPYRHKAIKLGAQDCFWEKEGPFTGEVSPLMLKNLGCQYVILGHSERRRYLKETDEMINKKIKAALGLKLKPIFCIGETENERNKGKTKNILKFQISKGLKGFSRKEIKNIIIAYEPVWAIGTGKPCEPQDAQKMSFFIRKTIAKIYGPNISQHIRIIYGGSVNSKNALSYVKKASFLGLLIGGASLKAGEFIKIIKSFDEFKS